MLIKNLIFLPVAVFLDIKSPAPGEYANPQLLYVENGGFEWIRYTLNGSDPAVKGVDYKTPVEIRRYGNVNLKIAAKPYNTEEIIRHDIEYRVNTKAPLKNIPVSGFYSDKIIIKNAFNGYNYCLEDRSPVESDPQFFEELVINPIIGGLKYTVLRLKRTDDSDQYEFRFFYIIDDRSPASPIISTDLKTPVNNDVNVTIDGPE